MRKQLDTDNPDLSTHTGAAHYLIGTEQAYENGRVSFVVKAPDAQTATANVKTALTTLIGSTLTAKKATRLPSSRSSQFNVELDTGEHNPEKIISQVRDGRNQGWRDR